MILVAERGCHRAKLGRANKWHVTVDHEHSRPAPHCIEPGARRVTRAALLVLHGRLTARPERARQVGRDLLPAVTDDHDDLAASGVEGRLHGVVNERPPAHRWITLGVALFIRVP